MSSFFKDIVDDYKSGIREVYYKQDLKKGISLLVSIVGIVKFAIAIGGVAAGAIGGIISWAGNHPQAASNCAGVISKYSKELKELFTTIGQSANSAYNSLSEKDKKSVRTTVLFIAGKIDWDSLH